jgi:hypothetical protein
LNLDDDKSLSGPAKRDVVDNRQTDKKARPRFYKDKAFMTSSLLVYAAAGFDIHETMREKWFWSYNHPPQKASAHFVDSDPVARPIVDLPNPAYLAVSVAMATGLNWLSWKMKHSRRFRRVWWLPQVITIQNNIWGGLNCEVDTNDNIDWLKQLNGWKTLPPAIPNTKH